MKIEPNYERGGEKRGLEMVRYRANLLHFGSLMGEFGISGA